MSPVVQVPYGLGPFRYWGCMDVQYVDQSLNKSPAKYTKDPSYQNRVEGPSDN
jgi:hypothetical protein